MIVESCHYYGDLIKCSNVPVAYVFMWSINYSVGHMYWYAYNRVDVQYLLYMCDINIHTHSDKCLSSIYFHNVCVPPPFRDVLQKSLMNI